MLDQQTVAGRREMRLDGMAEGFLAQAHDPDVQGLSFEERFGLPVDREWNSRQDRRLASLLKAARLRLPACMEDIDYQVPRGLDHAVMQNLATGNWIRAHQGVIIVGPTGVGKTLLACALANAACSQGFSARYYRVLAIARPDGSYASLMNKLAKTEVLVLDDWGITPLGAQECRDMLEVIDDRAGARSTIVASQIPIEHWHATISDPTVADAILDRLVHTSHKIAMKGKSMRRVKNSTREADHHDS